MEGLFKDEYTQEEMKPLTANSGRTLAETQRSYLSKFHEVEQTLLSTQLGEKGLKRQHQIVEQTWAAVYDAHRKLTYHNMLDQDNYGTDNVILQLLRALKRCLTLIKAIDPKMISEDENDIIEMTGDEEVSDEIDTKKSSSSSPQKKDNMKKTSEKASEKTPEKISEKTTENAGKKVDEILNTGNDDDKIEIMDDERDKEVNLNTLPPPFMPKVIIRTPGGEERSPMETPNEKFMTPLTSIEDPFVQLKGNSPSRPSIFGVRHTFPDISGAKYSTIPEEKRWQAEMELRARQMEHQFMLAEINAKKEQEKLMREFELKQQQLQLQQLEFQTQQQQLQMQMLNESVSNNAPRRNYMKTEAIKFPRFNGDTNKYLAFKKTFQKLVDEYEYSDAQKFITLKNCLDREAKEAVEAFADDDENYEEAWKVLDDRYVDSATFFRSLTNSIRNCPSTNKKDPSTFSKILNAMKAFEPNMKRANLPTNKSTNLFIADMVLDKIIGETNDELIKVCKEKKEFPTIEILSDFLTSQFQIASAKTSNGQNVRNNGEKMNVATKIFVTSNNNNSGSCFICKELHTVLECPKLKQSADKLKLLRQHKICVFCARHRYIFGKTCNLKNSLNCGKCQGKHADVLCQNSNKQTIAALTVGTNVSEVALNNQVQLNENCTNLSVSTTILPTAVVNVLNQNEDQNLRLRALLDSCSQSSYITEEMVQKLKLKKKRIQVSSTGLGGTTTTKITSSVIFNIVLDDESLLKVKALVVKKITKMPTITQHKSFNWGDKKLADPTYYKAALIPILLGANVLPSIMKAGVARVHNVLLQDTVFGWTIMGNIQQDNDDQDGIKRNFLCVDPLSQEIAEEWKKVDEHLEMKKLNDVFEEEISVEKLDQIETQIKMFWDLPILKNSRVESENEFCEKLFKEKSFVDENGVIYVPTPYKSDVQWPSNSYSRAYRFLMMNVARYKKDEKLRIASDQYMQDYLDKDHMRRVMHNLRDKTGKVYYPGVHSVWKGDKIRNVFDFSAKSENGISLNDVTCVGPSLQAKLFSIIIKNRFYVIVVIADIEKFYRQIRLLKEDREKIRWLWMKDGVVGEYEPTTISQGISCGSWQANRARHLVGELTTDSRTKEVITNQFYMDDMNVGFSSIQDAQDTIKKVDETLFEYHLPLLKFYSNVHDVLKGIEENRKLISTKPDLYEPSSSISMLGIRYLPHYDAFHFIFKPKNKNATTKRQMLSYAATIFDPLGFLSPIILFFKLILQKVIYKKLNWDQTVPDEITNEFNKHFSNLHLLNKLRFNRWMQTKDHNFELVGFSDSSKNGYSCNIYVRVLNDNGNYEVNFLTSKNRIVPAVSKEVVESQITIPKLELIAIELLVETFIEICKALDYKPKCLAYSDSKVAIAWLRQDEPENRQI
jgi:hypothetical protein